MDERKEKSEVLSRLKKIEGQVRGIQRMIEGGVPCADVLTQVAAVTGAMKKTGMAIVQSYLEECLSKLRKKPSDKSEEALKDFQTAISRYMDWA